MTKTHYKADLSGGRHPSQSEYEYQHQTACGYVRKHVTSIGNNVDCKRCLNSIHMISYHATNRLNGAEASQ